VQAVAVQVVLVRIPYHKHKEVLEVQDVICHLRLVQYTEFLGILRVVEVVRRIIHPPVVQVVQVAVVKVDRTRELLLNSRIQIQELVTPVVVVVLVVGGVLMGRMVVPVLSS